MKEGWEEKKLGDLAKTSAGGTPLKSKKEYYEGGSIPWLQSGEVAQAEIHTSKKYITDLGLQNSSAKLFSPDSVLVAMYGATAGQVGILKFEAATNQAVCGIFPEQDLISKYTYFFFLHHKSELLKQAVGNAQPNISQAKIKNTLIPIPPLAEQEAIVEVLDKAFAAIEQAKANIEQNIANAKELFQSKLNQIFSQKGDGWVEIKLSKIIKVKHGFAFKSKFFTTEGDHVLLTPGNYYEEGGYKDRGSKQKYYTGEIPDGYVLEKDDLLLAMTEQAAGLLGSPLLVPESDIYLHNQRLGLIEHLGNESISNRFLFHAFNTKSFREEIHNTGTGVKVRHTSPTKICDTNINITYDSKIQAEVIKTLETLKTKTETLVLEYQTKLTSLDELKKSILQKAFAGELT